MNIDINFKHHNMCPYSPDTKCILDQCVCCVLRREGEERIGYDRVRDTSITVTQSKTKLEKKRLRGYRTIKYSINKNIPCKEYHISSNFIKVQFYCTSHKCFIGEEFFIEEDADHWYKDSYYSSFRDIIIPSNYKTSVEVRREINEEYILIPKESLESCKWGE